MIRAQVAGLLLTALSAGCQGAKGVPFCDGSSGLRLAIAERPPAGRITPGQQVLYDNGAPYLLADGACNYWVSDAGNLWNDVRSGVLTESQELDLSAQLDYGAWNKLAGDWPGHILDGDFITFSNGADLVVCDAGCNAKGTPSEVPKMQARWKPLAAQYWQSGSAIGGPVRVLVVRYEPDMPIGDAYDWQTWPLSTPIDSLALSELQAAEVDVGTSTLISDPGDEALLRQMRRAFAAGPIGDPAQHEILVQDGASHYRVAIRDYDAVRGRQRDRPARGRSQLKPEAVRPAIVRAPKHVMVRAQGPHRRRRLAVRQDMSRRQRPSSSGAGQGQRPSSTNRSSAPNSFLSALMRPSCSSPTSAMLSRPAETHSVWKFCDGMASRFRSAPSA